MVVAAGELGFKVAIRIGDIGFGFDSSPKGVGGLMETVRPQGRY